MGLISLLISLAAENKLTSPFWQFNFAFSKYFKFTKQLDLHSKVKGVFYPILLLTIPVVITFVLLYLIEDSILDLVLSTTILIVCFGCVKTRQSYKKYLQCAYRGEASTCDLYYEQLLTDKNLPAHGFGQTLIWLNYRYYIAVMFFFVFFGAAGAVFYRLLCTLDEQQKLIKQEDENSPALTSIYSKILFWVDWLPVRIATFGLILVGHFSKAFPTWLENIFDIHKPSQCVLIDVAQKAEDIMIENEDCTAEPCLLVRLAKRNVMLLLTTLSTLILLGIIR